MSGFWRRFQAIEEAFAGLDDPQGDRFERIEERMRRLEERLSEAEGSALLSLDERAPSSEPTDVTK